jgi:hypothetical protein
MIRSDAFDDADDDADDGDLPRPSWEDPLSELTEYRKLHGHCNVPKKLQLKIDYDCWIELLITMMVVVLLNVLHTVV